MAQSYEIAILPNEHSDSEELKDFLKVISSSMTCAASILAEDPYEISANFINVYDDVPTDGAKIFITLRPGSQHTMSLKECRDKLRDCFLDSTGRTFFQTNSISFKEANV